MVETLQHLDENNHHGVHKDVVHNYLELVLLTHRSTWETLDNI